MYMENLKKKSSSIWLLISAVTVLGYFYTMIYLGSKLSLDVILGIVKPLGVFAFSGVIFSGFFLFFSEALFRSWLKHIAWWYILGLVITILNTPVYSSNVLSVDRAQVAFSGVVFLAIITIPYIFWICRKLK